MLIFGWRKSRLAGTLGHDEVLQWVPVVEQAELFESPERVRISPALAPGGSEKYLDSRVKRERFDTAAAAALHLEQDGLPF